MACYTQAATTFYKGLLEEPTLNPFESGWLEALGHLAWYRMHYLELLSREVEGEELCGVYHFVKRYFF